MKIKLDNPEKPYITLPHLTHSDYDGFTAGFELEGESNYRKPMPDPFIPGGLVCIPIWQELPEWLKEYAEDDETNQF